MMTPFLIFPLPDPASIHRSHGLTGMATKGFAALDPHSALAQHRYGIFLLENGRLDEASMRIKAALALDPLSPILNATMCNVAYYQQTYDLALQLCDRALEIQPDQAQALILRAASLYQKKEFAAALAHLKRARQSARGKLYYAAVESLGSTYYALGRYDLAESARQELAHSAERDHDILVNEAGLLAAMGQPEQALSILQRASLTWPKPPVDLLYSPVFSSLRQNSQFAEVLSRRSVGPEPDLRVGGDWEVTRPGGAGGHIATFH